MEDNNKSPQKITTICPLCGEKELNVNTDENSNGLQQCISCGYSTNDSFSLDNGDINTNDEFKDLDPFMKKFSKTENNFVWIPSVMQLPIGIYYPSEKNDELIWMFAPLVNIPEEQQKKYPKPDGGFYEKRYDMEKQLEFTNFGEGVKEIQTVMSMIEENEKAKSLEEDRENGTEEAETDKTS
tara:strand:+ start:448 stop:996 length:549 start_codon:yes stop_codon:yes gene_type:complete